MIRYYHQEISMLATILCPKSTDKLFEQSVETHVRLLLLLLGSSQIRVCTVCQPLLNIQKGRIDKPLRVWNKPQQM